MPVVQNKRKVTETSEAEAPRRSTRERKPVTTLAKEQKVTEKPVKKTKAAPKKQRVEEEKENEENIIEEKTTKTKKATKKAAPKKAAPKKKKQTEEEDYDPNQGKEESEYGPCKDCGDTQVYAECPCCAEPTCENCLVGVGKKGDLLVCEGCEDSGIWRYGPDAWH